MALPPRPAAEPSHPALDVADQLAYPANAPQLPASVAKHPLILLAAAIATIVGSVWVVSPSDNKVAIERIDRRLTPIEQSQAAMSKSQAELKDYLQRHLDKHEDRIKRLEEGEVRASRWRDGMDRGVHDVYEWQKEVRDDIKDLRREIEDLRRQK